MKTAQELALKISPNSPQENYKLIQEIQLAINSATAKLREENEKLKAQIETKKFDYGNDPEMVFHEELGWLHQLQVSAYTELKLRVEELEKERDSWKASHDNQVKLRRELMDRPDLKERATLVTKLHDEIESLQKQIVGLREVLQLCQIASCTCMTKSPEIKFHDATCRYRKVEECLAESTNFSHLYVRREVLEKTFKALEKLYAHAEEFSNDYNKGDFELPSLAACDMESMQCQFVESFEALNLARKELGE